MYWFFTCSVCFAAYTAISAGTFSCPSLFNWYPDVTDCSKFYRCIWGKAQSFACPTGTSWSQKLLTCDFQHLVTCQAAPSSEIPQHRHSQENAKNQASPDLTVDLKNDFQSQHKNPQKVVTEKGSYKRPRYHDSEIENRLNDDDYTSIQPDYRQEHQHSIENTEPQDDKFVVDSNIISDFTFSHFPMDKKSKLYQHRIHDVTEDGHWDYFYQEDQDDEEVIDGKAPNQNTDMNDSKVHSLQQFLEEFLSSQRRSFQHQPSPGYTVQKQRHQQQRQQQQQQQQRHQQQRQQQQQQQQRHQQQRQQQQQQEQDILAPAAAAHDAPPASALETARKQLLNEFLVSKLLQHSQFSGYLYKPHTLINTDGTYDVLDVQLQTPDSGHNGHVEPYRSKQLATTDPWPMTDFFRAGYGYKRIFNAK